jgi:anthranilate synthase component 1
MPVVTLLSDGESPVSLFHRLSQTADIGFLLESSDGDSRLARYSFLGVNPVMTVTFEKGLAVVTGPDGETVRPFDNPLQCLKTLSAEVADRFAPAPGFEHLPFLGGWVGYMGYAATHYFDNIPKQGADPYGVPEGYWGLYDTFMVFDHLYRRIHLISHAGEAALEALLAQLRTPGESLPPIVMDPLPDAAIFENVTSTFDEAGFADLVRQCQQYVQEGQVFQIVPSHRFSLPVTAPPINMYRLVQAVNPSPYAYCFKFPGFYYLGSSPETLLSCHGGKATLRALAGTRHRGATAEEDAQLADELIHHEKELAEHHMLVDLERNDLGRVCQVGSIRVGPVATLLRYTHVMHLSTDVSGTLRPDMTVYEAAQSCFPRGTLSGAPKIRAMQLLAELEPEQRGIYSGLVGYFDYRGGMDSAIAIRSVLVKDGVASVNAGAGVVYDSDPVAEYQETRNKAKSMLNAVQMAERQVCPASF